MNYLLDVNILVAWGWKDHSDHDRVGSWIAREKRQHDTAFWTSPIPELGFVRVSVQRAAGTVPVKEACKALAALIESLGTKHGFVPDDLDARSLPAWCKGASRTTDAYLLNLAGRHRAVLATLDRGHPWRFRRAGDGRNQRVISYRSAGQKQNMAGQVLTKRNR